MPERPERSSKSGGRRRRQNVPTALTGRSDVAPAALGAGPVLPEEQLPSQQVLAGEADPRVL